VACFVLRKNFDGSNYESTRLIGDIMFARLEKEARAYRTPSGLREEVLLDRQEGKQTPSWSMGHFEIFKAGESFGTT
jgi:hypothetical protein